eukprot:1357716-Amphidinium_carterae.1
MVAWSDQTCIVNLKLATRAVVLVLPPCQPTTDIQQRNYHPNMPQSHTDTPLPPKMNCLPVGEAEAAKEEAKNPQQRT